MNKTLTSLTTLIFFSVFGFGQSQINWLTWEEASKKMEEEPKKIFIDLYTDWCGWCKKMDQTTFKDPEIIKAMNENYYAVKFDAERKDTVVFDGYTFVNPKPNGKRSTHMFAASLLNNQLSYPSFVVLDKNFNRLHIIKGYKRVNPMKGLLYFFGTDQHRSYQNYVVQQIQQRQQQAQQQKNNQR